MSRTIPTCNVINVLTILEQVCYDLHFCNTCCARRYLARLYDNLQMFRHVHCTNIMTMREYLALVEDFPEYFYKD